MSRHILLAVALLLWTPEVRAQRILLNPSDQEANPVDGGGSEADYARAIARTTHDLLVDFGFDVLVHEDLRTAPQRAEEWDADVFLSIHSNAGGGHGVETLYKDEADRLFADAIQRALIAAYGLRDRGLKPRDDLLVLNATTMPAALTEVLFHDHPEEAAYLRSGEGQATISGGLADGVCDYFEVECAAVPEAECDLDSDGHAAVACGGGDCDDSRARIHPGAQREACDCDGVEDCRGVACALMAACGDVCEPGDCEAGEWCHGPSGRCRACDGEPHGGQCDERPCADVVDGDWCAQSGPIGAGFAWGDLLRCRAGEVTDIRRCVDGCRPGVGDARCVEDAPRRCQDPLFAPPWSAAGPGLYDGRAFYYNSNHLGVDIELPEGAPIRAGVSGTIAVYRASQGYGELVVVIEVPLGASLAFADAYGQERMTDTVLWILGHLRDSEARGGPPLGWQPGDAVTADDVVGYINDDDHNGDGTEHLHIGLRLMSQADAVAADPRFWFRGYESDSRFGEHYGDPLVAMEHHGCGHDVGGMQAPHADCGDGVCNGDEGCGDCPGDCGQCAPRCGDGVCNGDEDCGDCPGDCGQCAVAAELDGCDDPHYVPNACAAGCYACESNGEFVAFNETGCGGATCFERQDGRQWVAMYTRRAQTAHARWIFPEPLSGRYRIAVNIPAYGHLRPPNDCARWNLSTDVRYNLKRGDATAQVSDQVDQSFDAGRGWKQIFEGQMDRVTSVTVSNAWNNPAGGCGHILLDALRIEPL